jgi:hypothetical protein
MPCDEYYKWLCSAMNNPENDVTADFESVDPSADADILAICTHEINSGRNIDACIARIYNKKPRSEMDRHEYALIRSYGNKSSIAVIKDTYLPYGNSMENRNHLMHLSSMP